jgi:hypothetical protein
MIASWREQIAAYEERGKTDEYWKRVAERDRHGIRRLEEMLRWAQSTMTAVLLAGYRI